jgi:uncharacterized protein YjbI with pentapeptide repeats
MLKKQVRELAIQVWFAKSNLGVRFIGGVLGLAAMTLGIAGYSHLHPEGFSLHGLVQDFYANVAAELAGISITVLIVDSIVQRRESDREKQKLIRWMKSDINSVAVSAATLLRVQGWLFDGSLQKIDLSGADLQKASLYDSSLAGINASRVNLCEADLARANLSGSNFHSSYFCNAKLMDANLSNVDLTNSQLIGCHLNSASLANACLRDANFSEAKLYNARLNNADISNATLKNVFFNGADFTDAKCDGSSFEGSKLYDARFIRTSLKNSDLRQTWLNGVDFTDADLSGADLTGVIYFNFAQFMQASRMRGVRMPDGNIYDGRFSLSGDLEDAQKSGVDTRDTLALAIYYGITEKVFLLGHEWMQNNQGNFNEKNDL